MKKLALGYFTDTHLTVLGLLLFLFCFVGFVFFTFHKSRINTYKQIEQMPLHDEEFT